MISSISGSSISSVMPNRQQTLSEEQQQLVKDTLAKFDTDNLTQADAQSIVEAFEEAGIQPGRGLSEAMSAEGFDARSVGDMAGVEGPGREGMPPPPPPSGGSTNATVSDETLQQLYELLEEYQSENLSGDERDATLTAIQEIFQEAGSEGGLVNVRA